MQPSSSNRVTPQQRLAPVLALALAVALAACTNPGPNLPAELTVVDYAPVDGTVDVPVDAALSVTFDRALNPAATFGAFSLVGPDGSVVGMLTLSGDRRTATFTPAVDLAPGTTYTATVAGTVRAVDGGELTDSRTWSFTTAGSAGADPIPAGL